MLPYAGGRAERLFKTMINSAVQRLNTGVFKLNNNKKSIVALTTEKLSGFGVSCSKSAVHLSQALQKKVGCIFVAEFNLINNNL